MSGPGDLGGGMDRIGEYTWHPSTDRWEWNDTMFHLLGYLPGQVRPSRALVVSHKHPADRAQVEHVMADACSNRLAYTHRHRIVSVTGEVHEVTAIGFPVPDSPSLLLRGYLVHLATSLPTPTAGVLARPPARSDVPSFLPPTGPVAIPDPLGTVVWPTEAAREHDRLLGRAVDVLADVTELPGHAASALLAHLANVAALPLIVVAERVIAVSLDPDVEGLGGLLGGLAVPELP
ncbi:PAS domain-containing protein [Actinomycetospora termitidis]|uniref:PAS domain-containing protein n=1 Tax=Actinomycetospora termitidis TaxID=3053470 RepID=A0ABT7MGU7_9PSEU|nr:PAS domain-containing protein [Actinomycetospora sp. Odt1-22]MDL5159903.1 PAS domain-containing protein [Actinomycetospora sp. Odt1-22]